MRVGILTTFSNLSETYSLAHDVKSNIKMLTEHGYDVVLFVQENFNKTIELDCEIRNIVPRLHSEKYTSISAVPKENIRVVKEALEKHMTDIDICFTHDIILQHTFFPHNLAVRQVNLPILWLHVVHSVPSSVPIASLPEGHKIVYLNYSDRIYVAERFGTWLDNVLTLYNDFDIKEIQHNPLVDNMIKVFDNKDVKVAYAFCTTRMGAKGVEKLLKLLGKIKSNNKSVGVLLINSNARKEASSIEVMKRTAYSFGLDDNDFLFTSTLDEEYNHGIPNECVLEIFTKTNLFIFPTISEACPRVLLEAMCGENLLVLNEDIPALKELGGFDSALYMKFGSIWNNTSYANEEAYYNDWAKMIIRMLPSDMPKRAKERVNLFSSENIWKTQMSHMLPV